MGPLHGWAAWVLRVRRDQACGLSSSLSLPPGSHRTEYYLLQERLAPPPCHRSHTLLGSLQGTGENHAWSPSPRSQPFPSLMKEHTAEVMVQTSTFHTWA